MGSSCFVIENGKTYIVNSLGEWICPEEDVKNEEVKVEEEKETLNLEEILKDYILKSDLNLEDYVLKSDVELEKLKEEKFEVSNLPEGSLVDYREKEIRILCPEDVEWKQQNVGENGNPNMYYMTFRAYAPEGAVSFKEGDRGVIIDEKFDFNHSATGTDKYGRNYSVCWLALASLSGDQWTYFGKTSSESKMIGWSYIVEWYDANDKLIGTDKIRINLANKDCYTMLAPYYG